MDNLDENRHALYPTHTLSQNRIDLGYHEKEFQKRASFTYTILNNVIYVKPYPLKTRTILRYKNYF